MRVKIYISPIPIAIPQVIFSNKMAGNSIFKTLYLLSGLTHFNIFSILKSLEQDC